MVIMAVYSYLCSSESASVERRIYDVNIGAGVVSGLMKMGQFVEEQHSTITTDYSIRAAEKGW
jgi:hypothetical protein